MPAVLQGSRADGGGEGVFDTEKTATSHPLISVIVTVYNMLPCLPACMESLLAQTWPHFELWLIDDGSTDGSAALCDEFAQKDSRVKVQHQPNGGLSHARNVGVRCAAGDYVAFVDADDTVAPEYLETLLSLCQTYGVPLAACNHTIVRGGRRTPRFSTAGQPQVMDARAALEGVMYQQAPDVSCWGKLYERRLLEGDPYPDGKLYEDTAAFGGIMLRAGALAFTPRPLYDYILRNDSLSHGSYSDVRYQYIEAVEGLTKAVQHAFPDLQEACLCRMGFALLSVRRYFVGCGKALRPKRNALEKQIRGMARLLLKNHRVPRRDKAAVLAVMLGPCVYDILWRVYEKCRQGK